MKRNNNSKAICDGCNKEIRNRHISYIKGKNLCTACKRKTPSSRLLRSASTIRVPLFSKERALNKIYEVKTYHRGEGKYYCLINLPIILSGCKLKLIEDSAKFALPKSEDKK